MPDKKAMVGAAGAYLKHNPAEIVRVLRTAAVRERLSDIGTEAVGSTPGELHTRLKGGTDHPANLQLAHAECNWRKGSSWKPPTA